MIKRQVHQVGPPEPPALEQRCSRCKSYVFQNVWREGTHVGVWSGGREYRLADPGVTETRLVTMMTPQEEPCAQPPGGTP
jgi:hypothetical protein